MSSGRNSSSRQSDDYKNRLGDYKEVSDRITEFYEKFPEGSLSRVDPHGDLAPLKLVEIGNKTFIEYTAFAYRTPGDEHPAVGTAWEPFPGATPYTRDSEAMNAETSAWGRACVAAGILARGEKLASANEVRSRHDDGEEPNGNDGGKAPDAPRPNDTELGVLVELGLSLPSGKEQGEDWCRDAALKRFAFHVKKGASNPLEATLAELRKAHQQNCGEDCDHMLALAKLTTEEPAAA